MNMEMGQALCDVNREFTDFFVHSLFKFSFIPKLSSLPKIGSSFLKYNCVVKMFRNITFLAENRWNALWSISICLPIEEVQNWHIFTTSFLKGFLNPYGQCNPAMNSVSKWTEKSLILHYFKLFRARKIQSCTDHPDQLSKGTIWFVSNLI